MNLNDVIALINTNRGNGKKENLKRMMRLMDALDHPETGLSIIHVAGTNGKGSTCAYISQILQQATLNVGLFTSPHLESIHERIQINGQYIDTETLIDLTQIVKPVVDQLETQWQERFYAFEILTAIAFLYFKKQAVDIVVLETGVGGTIDATNIITHPLVSVITAIGHDHTHVLGSHLTDITYHKAGIIKPDCPVVLYPQSSIITDVVKEISHKLTAPLTCIDIEDICIHQSDIQQQVFEYRSWGPIKINMIGRHQIYNSVVAIEVINVVRKQGYRITDNDVLKGLAYTKWQGRLQLLQQHPLVLIDGAHNQEGVIALKQSITQLLPKTSITLVIGMMADKPYIDMIREMDSLAQRYILVSPSHERGFNVREVEHLIISKGKQVAIIDSVDDLLMYIAEIDTDEPILIFGSLYLVGDVLAHYIPNERK